jgi:hypothetical protein
MARLIDSPARGKGTGPADLVLPISERLRGWLASDRYRELRDRERHRLLEEGLSVELSATTRANRG